MIFHSIKGRLTAICLSLIWLSNSLLFCYFSGEDWWFFALVLALVTFLSISLIHYFFTPLSEKLSAIEGGLLNFKDNEFSITLDIEGKDELSEIAQLYNQVAVKLRNEKQYIYQRELLLDKVIESSPIVMFLVDDDDYFVYSNSASRHFLNKGERLEGEKLFQLKKQWPESLQVALTQHTDGLFSIESNGVNETWHLSRGAFVLNNKRHHLFLLKHMTRELNRQEVIVWKKVIRVISHELNNSLAPISSVSHSGKIIANKLGDDKLVMIFDTIKERVEHLNHFILGYARFAKLPNPIITEVLLSDMITKLQTQFGFTVEDEIPELLIPIDVSQIEQVLINLLKNAYESESIKEEVTLAIKILQDTIHLIIKDKGTGMSEQVLKNALVPFYSTKQAGTGLGLALCREIIEAHNGRLSLHNRVNKGLAVIIELPLKQ